MLQRYQELAAVPSEPLHDDVEVSA